MAISAPVVTCAHSSAGSRCVAYVPAKAARLSELPGDTAASRPAVFTCVQPPPVVNDYYKTLGDEHRIACACLYGIPMLITPVLA